MREFRFALRQTIPVFFTYLFLGIAFGILMSAAGLLVVLLQIVKKNMYISIVAGTALYMVLIRVM